MNLKIRAFYLPLVFYSGQSHFKTSGPSQTSYVLTNSPPYVDKMVGTNKLRAAIELIHLSERLDIYLTGHAIRNNKVRDRKSL